MEEEDRVSLERQLSRQLDWFKETWLWILRTKVLIDFEDKPAALDVGCGPGFVMDLFNEHMDVVGVDLDPDMVAACTSRGLEVQRADGADLPFEDDSFDVVYCSVLLMWVEDPERALEEMVRVSRGWVLCLAEPDFGGRIDYPVELGRLVDYVIKGVERMEGDPFIGRRLRELYSKCGIAAEVGIHPGVWEIEKLDREFEDEWRTLRAFSPWAPETELKRLKGVWQEALDQGSLFQYNPIFYAIGRV